MSNTAEVQFVGSAQQLMAEYDKLKGKNQQLERDLRAVGQASKQANADQKQLARDAKAAIEATLTPLERYRKQMEQLKTALREGLITQEQFNRANREAHSDLTAAKDAADEYGRAAKKTFEETRTPLEKHNAQMARLRDLLAKGKLDQDTFNRAAKKQDELLKAAHPTLSAHVLEIGKAALGFAGVGSATAGIMLAAQAIKAEYEALLERQKQAAGEQEKHGDAFRKTLTSFTPDETVKSSEELDAEVQRIASTTGADIAAVDRVVGSALSSKGPLTNKQALGGVEEAFRLLPKDEVAAEAMSGVTLELAQQTDVKDPKALSGFVTQAKAATKIANDQSFGAAFSKGMIATMLRGDTPEQAAEIFATLGNTMGDREGARTGTAQTQLAEQLAEMFPELPSTKARIAHVQKNPQLLGDVLETLNLESAARAPVENILRGDPKALAFQQAAEREILPLTADSGAAWEKKVADIQSDPTQQVGNVGLGVAGAVDQYRRDNGSSGLSGKLREMLFTGDKALANEFNFPSAFDDASFLGIPIGDRAQARHRFEARIGRGDDPVEAGLATVSDIEGYFKPVPGRDSRPMNDSQVQLLAEIKGVLERMERKPAPAPMPSAGLNRSN